METFGEYESDDEPCETCGDYVETYIWEIYPILLKVLKVIDPNCSGHEICKVRWHILGKDRVHTSVFPMATIRIGEFADFKPMPRELFSECLAILRTAEVYKNAKRQVLYCILYLGCSLFLLKILAMILRSY